MARVLLVDDEATVTKYLGKLLEDHGHSVRAVHDALAAGREAAEFRPDAAVLDLAMPGKDGLEVLPELRAVCPRCQVIIYTGAGDIEKAVLAMRQGAYDFIQKPLNHEAVLLSLQRALEVRRLRDENAFLRRTYDAQFGPGSILVFSEKTRALLDLAARYRGIPDVPVLIEGESGTGKDLVARYIHHDESDYSRPFVAINCGAIPQALAEAELFGYAPGAFTGARAGGAPGKIEAASGGTLFLDEIAELGQGTQAKLLRFLEHGTFFPVGSTAEKRVEARIISATNRCLADAVAAGGFRHDLYYRVNVGSLRVPPLRERREEILPFVRHFLGLFGERFANPFHEIHPAAEKILLNAPWKGNVRELRNAVERAVLVQRGPVLLPEHVAHVAGGHEGHASQAHAPALHPADAPLPDEGFDLEQTMGQLILRALEKHNHNQSRTARYLSISREALRYRMQKFGLLRTAD